MQHLNTTGLKYLNAHTHTQLLLVPSCVKECNDLVSEYYVLVTHKHSCSKLQKFHRGVKADGLEGRTFYQNANAQLFDVF